MNTKKILGLVAVLALVAVAFVGAGAAAGTTYYVADDGVDSDSFTEDYPMSTTYFLSKTLISEDTVTVSANKTMTIPNGKTLDLNGANLTVIGTLTIIEGATLDLDGAVLTNTGTVSVGGKLITPKLNDSTTSPATNYLPKDSNQINLLGTSVLNVTGQATNLLSDVQCYIGDAAKGATIIVNASSTASGAKWVVTGENVTGATMTEVGTANVTRTNLGTTTGTTIVGYESEITYTVTIPDSVTLTKGSDQSATTALYKITLTNAGASTDCRAVVLKLASSENYNDTTLNVKNVYGGGLVPYYMVVTNLNPVRNIVDTDAVAAIQVDGTAAKYDSITWQTPGTDSTNKVVTSEVAFAGSSSGTGGVSGLSAGSYQDTLTFSVGIEDADNFYIQLDNEPYSESYSGQYTTVWKDSNGNVYSSIEVSQGMTVYYYGATGYGDSNIIVMDGDDEVYNLTISTTKTSGTYAVYYAIGANFYGDDGSAAVGVDYNGMELTQSGTLKASIYGRTP